MSNGIDFAGMGGEDVSQAPSSTGQPKDAQRGAQGPIQFTGDGGQDVGGTIADTSEKGPMPPRGDDIVFAGEVGND